MNVAAERINRTLLVSALGIIAMGLAWGALPGCNFYREKTTQFSSSDSAALSFALVRKQVFEPSCISCHGNSGGVNLESYTSVKAHLPQIEKSTLIDRTMPKNGSLTSGQMGLLRSWIQAGAPEFGQTQPSLDEPLQPNFLSIRNKVFEVRCISCHSISGSASGIALGSLRELLDSPRDLLIPGNPDESGLIISLTRSDDRRMPPPENSAALPESELTVIRKWIEIGAPEKPGDGPVSAGSLSRPEVSLSQLSYALIRDQVLAPRCTECHGSKGGVNLESYESVKKWLPQLSIVTLVEKTMPPNKSLDTNETQLLSAWIKAGAPEKAEADLPLEPLGPTYRSIQKRIFEPRCMRCHGPEGEASSIPLQPWKELLDSPRELVIPGNPEESGLFISITRKDDRTMPPPALGAQPLTEAEISAIREWIKSGALENMPTPE